MDRNKPERWKRLWNKYKFVALVAAAGLLLLAWPSAKKAAEGQGQAAASGAAAEAPDLTQTEQRMAAILSRISGVGQLELMLTLDKSAGQRFVQDTQLQYSGATEAPSDYQRASETVILSQGGGQEGLVLEQSVYPTYRGCLVVCEGGDRAEVQLAVTQAVSALTGLSSDRISVVKWQ